MSPLITASPSKTPRSVIILCHTNKRKQFVKPPAVGRLAKRPQPFCPKHGANNGFNKSNNRLRANRAMLNSSISTLSSFRVVDSDEQLASTFAEHVAGQDNIFSSGDKRLHRTHDSIEADKSDNDKPEPTKTQSKTADGFNNYFWHRSPVNSWIRITPDESKVPGILKLSFEIQVSALQTCEQVNIVGVRLISVVQTLSKLVN
ncbi:unnamed protein product [Polarella glacialis]|uniref:Uncharacterized protein n=1 Tax=Polarella glacialis TaxID=89957 RepID=A0A813E329_POLGL|nr:unnamed protein product [Polarella glacialis]